MKNILTLCIILSLTFCLASIAIAENNCPYDSDYKFALQKALVDYVKNPAASKFLLGEIKTMLIFYLQKRSITDSDCPASIIASLEKADQVPDNVMAPFSKDAETCDKCKDGAVCNQQNDKGQTCTCIDFFNNDGKPDRCVLKPIVPPKKTCEKCPDGTFCRNSNSEGQSCYCIDKDDDQINDYCMLVPKGFCFEGKKDFCRIENEEILEICKGNEWVAVSSDEFCQKCNYITWFVILKRLCPSNPQPTPTPAPTPSPKVCDASTGCKDPHAVPGCDGANTDGCWENYCTNGVQHTYVCDSNNNCVPGSTENCPSKTCEAAIGGDKWSHACSGSGPNPTPNPNPATCSGTGYECRPIYTGSDQSKACTSVAGKPAWDYVGTGKSAGCSDSNWPNCCKDPNGPGPNPNTGCTGSCEAIYLGSNPSDQTQQQYTCSRLGKTLDSAGYCQDKTVCCGSSTTPDSGKCFDTDNGQDPALSGICSKGTNHITDKCVGDKSKSINEAFCNGGENGKCAVTTRMACPANTVCKTGARGDACVPENQEVMSLDISLPKTDYKTCEKTGGGDKDMYVRAFNIRNQGVENVEIEVSCSDAGVIFSPVSKKSRADDGNGGAWFSFQAPYATGHEAPFQIVMTADGKQDDPAGYAPATVKKTLTITPRELIFEGDITTVPETKDTPAHPCDKIKFKACVKAKDPIADDLLIDYAEGITITFDITLDGKIEAKTCKIKEVKEKTGCCETEEWSVPDSITEEKEITVKASAKGNCYLETKPPKEYKFKVKPVKLIVSVFADIFVNAGKTINVHGKVNEDDKTDGVSEATVSFAGCGSGSATTDGQGGYTSTITAPTQKGTCSITATAKKKCYVDGVSAQPATVMVK